MKSVFGFSVKDIAEIAIFSALAIVLDRFVKINVGATGGSINISMVPLYIIALRHGWFKGFIAGGIVYGFISCLLDGYGLITYPLEYLVAFGSVAILGMFGKKINDLCKINNTKNVIISYLIMIGCIIVASVIRFFSASIDSVLLYELGWIEAFAYNAPYVFISAAGVCVVMAILLPSIKMTNNLYPTSYLKNK